MKVDQLFSELKSLAEKLGVEVSEQNFRTTGIAVKSGFCKVKDRDLFLIDKHLKKTKKAEVLAEYIAQLPLGSISLCPHLEEYLIQFNAIPAVSVSSENTAITAGEDEENGQHNMDDSQTE